MASDPQRFRVLREMAQAVIEQAVPDELPPTDRDDLVTSLVRQWITYDGNATLLSESDQAYFRLNGDKAKPDQIVVDHVSIEVWLRQTMRDWKVDEVQLNDLIQQLNVCQSADIQNRHGRPLRIWVNPKTRCKGIEPIDPPQETANRKGRNYRKLAEDALDRLFRQDLPTQIGVDLATALVRQWVTYHGRGLIMTADRRFRITIVPSPDGGCEIKMNAEPAHLGKQLLADGVPETEIDDVIHRINLGQTPEIADARGRRLRLRANPVEGRIEAELIG